MVRFSKGFTAQGWEVRRQELQFETFCDTISGVAEFLFSMHSSVRGSCSLVPEKVHAPRDAHYHAIEEHSCKEYDQ